MRHNHVVRFLLPFGLLLLGDSLLLLAQDKPLVSISNIPVHAIVGSTFEPKYKNLDGGTGWVTSSKEKETVCMVVGPAVAFLATGECKLTAHSKIGKAKRNGEEQSVTVVPAENPTISITNAPVVAQVGTQTKLGLEYNGDGEKGVEWPKDSGACKYTKDKKLVIFDHEGTCKLTPYASAKQGGVSKAVIGISRFILVVKNICDPAIVNHNCTIPIDREKAVAPPTIQAQPNAEISIFVGNTTPFEKVSIERTTATFALPPEPFATAFTAFTPSLTAIMAVQLTPPRSQNLQLGNLHRHRHRSPA
jgi:hypothetical protein